MQVVMQVDGVKSKTLRTVLIIVLISIHSIGLFSFNQTCEADGPPTLYVGEGELYTSIQDAIDNSSAGYRIVVYSGTYSGNLTIAHKLDLFGEDKSNTKIVGNGNVDVIKIYAANVNISHFTIENSGSTNNNAIIKAESGNSIITDNRISNGYHGILINNSNGHLIYDNEITNNNGDGVRLITSSLNDNISYNTITGNHNGIYLYISQSNNIYENKIQSNEGHGIFLNKTCHDARIKRNNVSNNNQNGIYLNDYSNSSIISNNEIYSNKESGIVLENCSVTTISNANTVNGNTNYGIMIVGSNNNVYNNIISYNKKDGVYLTADDNTTIFSNNAISHNTLAGIRLYNSTDGRIYGNEIYNNGQYGAYLDFFTKGNRIWNNYFHDNTQNAVDKSINLNTWQFTQSGPNIVGGPDISGNYWDDFDESIEEAYDNNNDGFADSAYAIYGSNKDNGPLLDVTPPSIDTPQVSPSSQSIGDYTNISVIVTDNTEVRNVYLVVTDPNEQTSNFSITQNKTGNTYFCNKQFLSVGNYSFRITAKDPRNWANSSNVTFYMHEGEPPIIVDNTLTTGSPYSSFTFNTTVTSSETSVSNVEVYVIWNHTGEWKNQSLNDITGNYFERTVSLNKSIDDLRYHFYARDTWGNAVTGENKTVTITDTQTPSIKIERYGSSFEDFPNSHTFGVTVTDDSAVSDVYIEYWYNGSNNMKSDMDYMGNNYYKKVIFSEVALDNIYCVIYANDTSGNSNNTKNPTAISGGPYSGSVLTEITFNGTDSFDLDGEITNYLWNFGDGTTGNISAPTHTYYSNGNYVITLTVTDNDDRTHTSTTQASIINFTKIETSDYTINSVSSTYNLNLTKKFYGYDTDGDGVVDTFFDPNDKLTSVHNCHVNISGIISFLLSVDDDEIPECLWNTFSDEITPVSYFKIQVDDDDIVEDDENEQATMTIIVDKANWIYIEVNDKYPDSPLTVERGDGDIIYSDMIWRKNGKIYVLDDPDTKYRFFFENIFPELENPIFSPVDGGLINENSTTITISYNTQVTIVYAAFGSSQIESNLVTTDNKVFTYTPLPYLDDGVYTLEIDAQALHGNDYVSSSTTYIYFAYAEPPQESFIEKNWMWIALGVTITILVTAFFAFKYKLVIIDDFIYIKNKKILPFFRTIIFGPVSVNVDSDNISKAEFYIDGKLKDALTNPPYLWKWNEKAYLKHTLETKIYDKEGNDTSSGEMMFYIFNPFKSR